MMDNNNENSQLEPVQNDQSDDFYLDDWLNEFGADDIQENDNPTGMEGIQVSSFSSNPNQRHNVENMEDGLCQGSAKKQESVSGICQQMIPVDSLVPDSSAVTSSDSGLTKQTTTEAFDQSSNIWKLSERHQLRKHILKHTVQPHNQPSISQANIQYPPQKLQNHIVPDQLHPSPLMLFTLQNQRQMGQSQHQQPLGLESKFCGLPPQQQIFQPQSDVLGPKTHQYPFHLFQQPGNTAPQQNFQKTSNQVHFNLPQTGITNNPNNSILNGMPQTSRNSAMLRRHQSVNIGEQQKPLEQSQGAYPESSSGASVDYTVHSANVALSDWYDQAYQQIQSNREAYLPDLVRLYKKAHELSLQSLNAESKEKFEKMKVFINKMIAFLKISRAELIPYSKERVMNYIKYITNYIRSVRRKNAASMQHHEQLRPRGNMSDAPQLQTEGNLKLQFNQLLGSPQMVPNTEMNTTNSMPNASFPGPQKGNSSNLLQYGSGRWPLQTNLIAANQSSQMRTDQRTLSPLQIGSFKSTNQNVVSMQQQTNSSSRNHVNISGAPTTTNFPFHHITRSRDMEIKELKQKVHHPPIDQNKQHISMHRMNEHNGALVGQVTSSSSRMLQQFYTARQHAEKSPHFLLPATPSHLQATSPQTSHHSISSPYIDKSNSLSPLSIGGIPLQPATSPCILPSPSTPSSISIDPERHSSAVSPLSATENTEHQTTMQNQVLDTIGPGASTTFLLTESSSPKDSQQSHAMGRLIDVVKSISSKAFQASLLEIGSVMNITDCIAETPKRPVGQDLVADIRSYLQDETDSRLHHGTASTEKVRRQIISALSLDASSSALSESDTDKIDGLTGQASDTESTSLSMNKRPMNEHTNAILEEIKERNRKLVETVLEVLLDPREVAARVGAHQDGTIVRCSYSAVCFPEMLRPQFAPSGTLPNFRLLLLVLDDYPNSSPVILDIFSDASSSELLEELLQNAKAKFNTSLRRLSQPISLGEMARTWDACSRAVFTEFTEQRGGRSFSSRYGSWENCITAP